MDQLLLWISMAFVVFLAARRRDSARLPILGLSLCIAGITMLVAHAMRDQLLGNGWAWLENHKIGAFEFWRVFEILSLVTVGIGVCTMSIVAESERRVRSRGKAARSVASTPSVGVVMSVLSAAPGATLMLRREHDSSGDFRVLYADEHAVSLLKLPARGTVWLSQVSARELGGCIATVAAEATSGRAMARQECPSNESWYEVAAGAHADGVLVMLTDVTERKRAELALTRVAYTDPVTGLANRTLLEREMDEGVQWARANPDHRFAVLCLDFDDFKGVNDRYGHNAGDALLVSIGTRLSAMLDEEFDSDTARFVAARWGGDEFVLLLKQAEPARVERFAARLCECLAEPHNLDGIRITSTASVGAAMCTDAHASGADVLQEADAAMYVAKHAGKNRAHTAWSQGGGPLPFPGNADDAQAA